MILTQFTTLSWLNFFLSIKVMKKHFDGNSKKYFGSTWRY